MTRNRPMTSAASTPELLGFELLRQTLPGCFHFVTTRQGGVSQGAYATLNCTHYCGDNPEHVRLNRERLLQAFPQPPKALAIPHQTHGTTVRALDDTFFRLDEGQQSALLEGVDALATRTPGLCLAISTADCVPILIADVQTNAVAAIHAGWRGTVAGIARQTIATLQQTFGSRPADLVAGIGPSISPQAFEVGDEVYQAFADAGFPMERIAFRHPQSGKWHVDLWEANRLQLLQQGLSPSHIEVASLCTYSQPERFFSARRLGPQSGRLLSGIMRLDNC